MNENSSEKNNSKAPNKRKPGWNKGWNWSVAFRGADSSIHSNSSAEDEDTRKKELEKAIRGFNEEYNKFTQQYNKAKADEECNNYEDTEEFNNANDAKELDNNEETKELNNAKATKGIDFMDMQKYIDRLDQDRRDMENRLREDRVALEERLVENDRAIEQRLGENLNQTEQRLSDSHYRMEEYVRRCIAEHKEERRVAEGQLNDRLKEVIEKMDKSLDKSEAARKLTIGVCIVTMLGIAAVIAAIIVMTPMWSIWAF